MLRGRAWQRLLPFLNGSARSCDIVSGAGTLVASLLRDTRLFNNKSKGGAGPNGKPLGLRHRVPGCSAIRCGDLCKFRATCCPQCCPCAHLAVSASVLPWGRTTAQVRAQVCGVLMLATEANDGVNWARHYLSVVGPGVLSALAWLCQPMPCADVRGMPACCRVWYTPAPASAAPTHAILASGQRAGRLQSSKASLQPGCKPP